jgi:hypothetical protein
MSIRELDEDTVVLETNRLGLLSAVTPSLDDTARMPADWSAGHRRTPPRSKHHPFAEGVIRFYRARTLLAGETGRDEVSLRRALRARAYLEPVEPRDLPPIARGAYLDLIYLIHEIELDRSPTADPGPFVRKVLEIALLIDEFVDELLSSERAAKPRVVRPGRNRP